MMYQTVFMIALRKKKMLRGKPLP